MNTGSPAFKSMAESDVPCPLLALFVISKETSIQVYIAFQDVLELSSVSSEYDTLAGQGGKKVQFYLRPIRDFPSAPRGICCLALAYRF